MLCTGLSILVAIAPAAAAAAAATRGKKLLPAAAAAAAAAAANDTDAVSLDWTCLPSLRDVPSESEGWTVPHGSHEDRALGSVQSRTCLMCLLCSQTFQAFVESKVFERIAMLAIIARNGRIVLRNMILGPHGACVHNDPCPSSLHGGVPKASPSLNRFERCMGM